MKKAFFSTFQVLFLAVLGALLNACFHEEDKKAAFFTVLMKAPALDAITLSIATMKPAA